MDELPVRTLKFVLTFAAFTLASLLISPVSHAGELYLSAVLTNPDLDFGYIPEKYEEKSGVSSFGYKLRIGKTMGDRFSVDGYYAKSSQLNRYKISELGGIEGELIDFFGKVFFGLFDSDLHLEVDSALISMGINARYTYGPLFVHTGVSKWDTVVDVTNPDGLQVASISDDGVGYNYGAGFKVRRGQHWAILVEVERYHFGDLGGNMRAVGVEYSF